MRPPLKKGMMGAETGAPPQTARKGARNMEQKELSYRQEGDYLVPDLQPPEDSGRTYGKYGMLRKTYLKEHRRGTYSALMLQGTLTDHLAEVDEAAREQVSQLVETMKMEAGLTEELKSNDPMEWVGRMNTLKQRAEEMVLAELVYT